MSKINNTFIDNAEDLDIVMSMYNLSEYRDNHSVIWGSSWNYYRDVTDVVDDYASESKSFKYKTKIIGKRPLWPGNPGDTCWPAQLLVPSLIS